MEGKDLIGKFIGIWSKERDLVRWINRTWNPKGNYDLHLGSKGFFTIIFFTQEDQDRILEGGPYLFFWVGLYLRQWNKIFNPEKQDMRVSLMGI